MSVNAAAMNTVSKMIEAKKDRMAAELKDQKAREEFVRLQKVKLFAPILEVLFAVRNEGVFFANCYPYSKTKFAQFANGELDRIEATSFTKLTKETTEFKFRPAKDWELAVGVRDDLKGFYFTHGRGYPYNDIKTRHFDNAIEVINELLEVVARDGITE